ncbi:MAG: 50S ribosomal protein L25 [Acidobacteria bacterium]|nr:50S ribosomal protein L25 [Acidobacteriota bacterium]
MSDVTVVVYPREETGKNANRRLRVSGSIPAVVYGGGKESVAIKVDEKMMHEFLQETGSENAVFLLKLGDTGKSRHAMIRDLQIDTVERRISHIDFQRVLLDEKVRVTVVVTVEGTSEGVKNQGGVLDFVTREVDVECLPADIPAAFTLDVTKLEVGDHVEAKDLDLPEGVELLSEANRVLVSIGHSRVAEDVEEAGEVEDVVTLIEEIPDEPEVIGRAKDEDEEDA